MSRIAVAGICGRMGRRIATLAAEHPELELAGGFERPGHEDVGRDIGEVLGLGTLGVQVADSIGGVLDTVDVVIDFTHPGPTIANLKAASGQGTAMVVGTTGFTEEELAEARALAAGVPCVMASNMSLGVNLLLKLLPEVARALGKGYDIEIVEAHHRTKKDAPSGTALMMARAISEGLGRNLDDVGVYARHGMIGERSADEIGIQTLRAGDIVGEHTVLFGGLGERVEITHKATSRDTFARGALRAALWLKGRDAGLYNMLDVLGL